MVQHREILIPIQEPNKPLPRYQRFLDATDQCRHIYGVSLEGVYMLVVKADGEDFTVYCDRCNIEWLFRLPQSADAIITFINAALYHRCKPLSNRDVLRSEA